MNSLSGIIYEIRNEWKSFAYAMTGAALLLIGYILFLYHETGYSAAFIIIGGAIDLPIIFRKMRTITSWTRGQFKRWLDRLILAVKLGLMAIAVYKWENPPTPEDVILAMAIACISWHLFANEAKQK